MGKIEKDLLLAVSDLHQIPSGAYSIRENGEVVDKKTTTNINIESKPERNGIDIVVAPNTVEESIHIPVIISKSGIKELVYNDFWIGENSDVLIVAGCGVHNTGKSESEHSGIHRFHLAKNAKVRYVERHIGSGTGAGKILNPVTEIDLDEGASLIMETTQLGGVTSSKRTTSAKVGKFASLNIKEKILTAETQFAESYFDVILEDKDAFVDVVSRSVARDKSKQIFVSKVTGQTKCFGHVECDAILMDNATVSATPEIVANSIDASLVHEAAIGKIAGEQMIKLMTLGLSEKEAEDMIISGFLS